MDKLNVILNGKITQAIKGETILSLAKRNGIEIPTLCNDERLEPYASCFVCVVEIEGMKGLQPSCCTKVVEGMNITTDNERVHNSRRSALELLLSNHYADCAAPCKLTCPAGVDVQGYIGLIEKGLYRDAVGLIKRTNPLPAICGRVCVRPCEVACRRNLVEGKGVGIDYLKRFATDMDFASGDVWMPEVKNPTNKKVCIIGAGPGGLSAAYYLSLEGHSVDIYEASPFAGGMLRYGIPPYRLPNEIIDKEVESITNLGVNIFYNQKLGDNLKFNDLKNKYNAFILAIGSQSGTRIGCDNDDAENVLSGIDFLRNMELTGQRYDFTGKKVAVIGGGNTAMDCCRTSMRCGAEKVYIIYRRTEKEMPANPIEIHESKLEGVEYLFLTAPGKVNTDVSGKMKTLTCFKMTLGEPDASGRRRPVKVDNSEFEIELDYILAAIGQKTNVNFINDINESSDTPLKLSKWGDIEVDKVTLRTSIENMFAAGDSVTGPATLIEAIAQGRKAAISCHQLLSGEKIEGEPYEFLSRRDNFEKQVTEDYQSVYHIRERNEMPTLEPEKRKNFTEVELGYSQAQALDETRRCLECGCTEYFTCDLKRYSTEYRADQKRYEGEYRKTESDFRHPYIEIDNNKCILCARCIRICRDVVGANALGLVDRGFDSYVSPSLGTSLMDTDCESCGLCISTCPTGAITENYTFKPGPYRLESFETICNYCSIGCELTLHHVNGYYMKVTGSSGLVNNDTNICRFGKFGYKYLNSSERVLNPLKKTDKGFEKITFSEAYKIICGKIKEARPDENAVFAGARLLNEEQYLLQKFTRTALKTNNITSFHYEGRGSGYAKLSAHNVPFEQIYDADRVYLVGTEINYENPVLGYIINNARIKKGVKLRVITDSALSTMPLKADESIMIKSYYYFIKSIIYYMLANGLENKEFLDSKVDGFDNYRSSVLKENFNELLKKSGVFFEKRLVELADSFINEQKSIVVFSEKHLSSNAAVELFNLVLISGKLGRHASGIICLKEKNNSQGLFDMGVSPSIGVGTRDISNDEVFTEQMKKLWKINELPFNYNNDIFGMLSSGEIKNLFIFGEDPLGCALDKEQIELLLSKAGFMVVQDYFITETAAKADIILPAALQFETGGSYCNTQKQIIHFGHNAESKIERSGFEQINDLMKLFNIKNKTDLANSATMEIAALLRDELPVESWKKQMLNYTSEDNYMRVFDYGCDIVVKKFEEEFSELLK